MAGAVSNEASSGPKKGSRVNIRTHQQLPRRKPHAKVKTGCLTCKIRRKKCDETRPACQKCISTGRKCDGYPLLDSFVAYEAPTTKYCPGNGRPSSMLTACTEESSIKTNADSNSSQSTWGFSELQLSPTPFFSEVFATSVQNLPIFQDDRHLAINDNSARLLFSVDPRISSPMSAHPATCRQRPVWSTVSSELDLFNFFCSHTVSIFSSYRDGSTWLDLAMMLGHTYPEVFYAAAACGAAHRQFTAGISSEAFQYYRQAKSLYQQALKSMRFSDPNEAGSSGTALLISRLLMAIFACFQDDMGNAVVHIQASMLSVLSRRTELLHFEERYCSDYLSPAAFETQIQSLRFETDRALGDSMKSCNTIYSECTRSFPHVFVDLRQARDLLFSEVDSIFSILKTGTLDRSQRRRQQTECVTRLFQWNVTYARTIEANPEIVSSNPHICRVLRTTQNASYLLAYLVLFSTPGSNSFRTWSSFEASPSSEDIPANTQAPKQALWTSIEEADNLRVNYARIVGLVESLRSSDTSTSTQEHAITLDSAIGPPREASPSGVNSSSKTRHLVKSLLPPSEGKDALWKMLDVYSIAERFSAVEEYAVISAIDTMVQPAVFPRWSSITHMIDSRRLLLRYCIPGDNTREIRWSEQLWALDL